MYLAYSSFDEQTLSEVHTLVVKKARHPNSLSVRPNIAHSWFWSIKTCFAAL